MKAFIERVVDGVIDTMFWPFDEGWKYTLTGTIFGVIVVVIVAFATGKDAVSECLAKTCPAGYVATYQYRSSPECLCLQGVIPK